MNDSYLNADSVCAGLEKLRKNSPDECLYVILDNAAYQRCKKVKACAEKLNINLIYLPAYSPNLNLIERLWKFLRGRILSNKYHKSFSEFYNNVESFLANVHINFVHSLDTLLVLNFECLDSSECIN